LLRDLNNRLWKEDNFKMGVGNDILHETNIDNVVTIQTLVQKIL